MEPARADRRLTRPPERGALCASASCGSALSPSAAYQAGGAPRPWTPSGMIDLRSQRPSPPSRRTETCRSPPALAGGAPRSAERPAGGAFEAKRRRASSCPAGRPRAGEAPPLSLKKGWFSQFSAANNGCCVYLTPRGAQVFVTSVTELNADLPVILSVDTLCVGDVVDGSARRWECGHSRRPLGSGEARLQKTKRKPVPRHSEDTQILFASPPASPTRGPGSTAGTGPTLTPKQRAWREQALLFL